MARLNDTDALKKDFNLNFGGVSHAAIDLESLFFTVGKRVGYLEKLYMKMQAVTGLTPERLLELFVEGYTLQAPDYRKNFEEMQRMAHMDWEIESQKEDKSDGKID